MTIANAEVAAAATERTPSVAQSLSAVEFAELYERFAPYVHAVLIAKLPPHEVEDTLQDVFSQAWSKIDQLESVASFGPWIAAIARHRAADYYRQRKIQVPLEHAPEPRIRPVDPILDALSKLPEAYQETLALRFIEGLSGPEIAALTGLTHGSVRVNLARGLQMLREIMGVTI